MRVCEGFQRGRHTVYSELYTVKREIFAAFFVHVFRIRTGLRGFNFAIAEFATVAFMLNFYGSPFCAV